MSIDVTFYSFEANRADALWNTFREDVVVIRKKKHAEHQYSEEIAKILQRLRPLEEEEIQRAQEAVLNYYEELHLFPPGLSTWKYEGDSSRSYEKKAHAEMWFNYLGTYGIMYPNGVKVSTDLGTWKMLDPKFKDILDPIRKKYHEEYQKEIDVLTKPIGADISLTPRQQELSRVLSQLPFNDSYSKRFALDDLFQADLHYGSVASEADDSEVAKDMMEEILYPMWEKTFGGTYVIEEAIIHLFEHVDVNLLKTFYREAKNKFSFTQGEERPSVDAFLRSLRPIAKDLKGTPGALFIIDVSGEYGPRHNADLLKIRAEKRLASLTGILPPVL